MKQGFPLHPWLTPIAWLYALGVNLRNKLFDWGWLRSRSFDVPAICVGNLAVGGTGKTPHIEYLIRLLSAQGLHIATLSRGYGRKTKGYLLADMQSSARQIGDEPRQIKQKYPKVQVAVCEKRCAGMERLLAIENPCIDVVLLDDAFQHRYIKPGLSILLTDYSRLLCDDCLLPVGLLREPAASKNRAQIVVVTKCPSDIKPIDFNLIAKRLHLFPYQQLYFSRVGYGPLRPMITTAEAPSAPRTGTASGVVGPEAEVLLVTGIARPEPLLAEVQNRFARVELLAFPDHHDFTSRDLLQIKERFSRLASGHRFLVTTEKDAARLVTHPQLDPALKPYFYVLPIEIEILQNQQNTFNQHIIGYVRKNQRNC